MGVGVIESLKLQGMITTEFSSTANKKIPHQTLNNHRNRTLLQSLQVANPNLTVVHLSTMVVTVVGTRFYLSWITTVVRVSITVGLPDLILPGTGTMICSCVGYPEKWSKTQLTIGTI